MEVDAPPQAIFRILDDVTRTPEWLKRCTKLEKLTDGPITVGQKLKYHYRDGSRTGVMDGEVAVHDPDRHLENRFTDKIMDVSVDFRAEPLGVDRTRLTHTITIDTKGMGKVFAPVIERQLPDQTMGAMTNLKALAEQH
ncbi:MAG: SRPBCC family protein [Lapillicoccus sp.]